MSFKENTHYTWCTKKQEEKWFMIINAMSSKIVQRYFYILPLVSVSFDDESRYFYICWLNTVFQFRFAKNNDVKKAIESAKESVESMDKLFKLEE